MCVIMDKVIFFHTPKTAGEWVRDALYNSTKVIASIGNHPFPRNVKHKLFSLCFVRHPLTWYQSFWAYKMRAGWVDGNPGIESFRDDDFNTFVNNVVTGTSGFLSRTMDRRIGHRMSFIGKYENLVGDLIKALELAEQPFDEKKLIETPPDNVSYELPEYKREIAEKVIKTEDVMLKRFGYSFDIDEVLSRQEERRKELFK